VVDAPPRFHLDALRWFATLTEVAGVKATDLVVHVAGGGSSEVLDFLGGQGVVVRAVEPFDARSPHCNKIAGALRLAEDPIEHMAVLCDTDLAVLGDPRHLVLPAGSIAGKPVDAPVPPFETLAAIFDAAGIETPSAVPLPWGPGEWTVTGNNNGGLYLVPGALLVRIAPAWARWARWLLDRLELLGEWSVYVDQVAMALGLASEGIGSVALDVRWNTPTHDPTRIPADAPEPTVLHYHQETDDQGLIRVTGVPTLDAQIAVANAAITSVWRRASPTDSHRRWVEDRVAAQASAATASGPPGVSSPGSRDRLVGILRPASVLQVGLSDGEPEFPVPVAAAFVGIDESTDAVDRARGRRPEATFLEGTLDEHQIEADLVLCPGLLLEQKDPAAYRSLLEDLWRSTRRALVVTGHGGSAPNDHLFEPLSTMAKALTPEAEAYRLTEGEGSTETFVLLRPPSDRHPRDYRSVTLDPLIDRHPDPVALAEVRVHAWRTIGFYPDHAPRLWEYPVVARLVREHLPAGSRLVDVGAGVTPLAPYLTSEGYVVDTVDPSTIRRTWPPQPDWNEWDYLDYGQAGLAHRSWNCTLGEVPRKVPFDGAYSVSVIEHLRAEDRRALLADIAGRVRRGGLVVLTIDLVRNGDDLWNRNRGIAVEDPGVHGTFDDIVAECAALGLELFEQERVRHWGDVEVDIGMVALRQTVAPSPPRWRDLGRRLGAKSRRTPA
jgi:hypothetical protein